ncbi:MAG TPA: YraN family protein [Candidatus Saccharimonadales bacterium]|nr:YraN family protein [Candidatus Saccharimonadales bacterium]
MTNYAHGHDAEKYAAEYLQRRRYKILALNWRHRRAEIDIVARRAGGPVTFVEVKYRESPSQGGGLDYITHAKLNQMQFAAELWMAQHRYSGECTLAAIELAGPDYEVTSFIEDLS